MAVAADGIGQAQQHEDQDGGVECRLRLRDARNEAHHLFAPGAGLDEQAHLPVVTRDVGRDQRQHHQV